MIGPEVRFQLIPESDLPGFEGIEVPRLEKYPEIVTLGGRIGYRF